MSSIYDSHADPQNAARFAVVPLQRIQVDLTVNRVQGAPIFEAEGTAVYIEHADYPAILSIVNPATGIHQSIPCKNGTLIKVPFKGLFLTHPIINAAVVGSQLVPRISLIICKAGAEYSNEYANPASSMIASWNQTSNTALLQSGLIFIPPGSRRLQRLEISLGTATTVTSALWSLYANGTAQNLVGSTSIVDQYGNAYATNNLAVGQLDVSQPITGQFKLTLGGLPIPTQANQLGFSVIGTGMTAPLGIVAEFA